MVFSLGIWAQSDNQNYIKTTSYKIPITNEYSLPTDPSPEEAVVQVSYFDGIGRPIQTIAKGQSADDKNIVTHIEYDGYGRETQKFLPYENDNPNINFISEAKDQTLDFYYKEYYQFTTNPYSETLIEKSPLNRIMKIAAPGNDWAMNSEHEIKYGYETNTSNEVLAFSVNTIWNSASGLYDISLQNTNVYYLPNQLYKKVTKDENHDKHDLERTEEFVDKQGRIILKRVWVIINPEFNRNPLTPHDTYYVYDQFGNLTYVIPPAVTKGGNIDSQTIESLFYQYKYDEKNRLVAKKIPSKQWEYIIYDKLDRVRATGPVSSPFTNLTGNGWLFTKYDNFNRPILTAWKQVSGTFNDILRKTTQDELNSVFYLSENANTSTVAVSGINYYYTHQSYPNIFNAYHVLTVNYYDNYRFINSAEIPTQVLGQNVRSGNAIKEIPTGSWVRIIEATNNYKANITFTCYKTDRMSSPIKSKTIYNTGGYTQAESVVNFAGEVGQTITKHKKTTTATEIIITENFTYSEQGRLLTHTHQINNDPTEFLTINTYDKLGQLTSKEVGGDGMNILQNVNFTYNIRGWLTDINKCGDLIDNPVDDLFSFKLSYNQPLMGATPLFNGNISESYWHTRSDDNLRNYEYSYDGLNRLKNAVSDNLSVDGVRGHFNETLSYDKNGNITHLLRTGGQENQFNTLLIDDLTYSYDPNNKNQLKKVVDLTNSPQGFKDDSNGTIAGDPNDDYLYDLDGNMIKDENKNITSIVYNHLNLPTKINFGTGSTIAYTYDATGVKLKKVVTTSTTISTTEYINGFQYNNDAVQFFPHAEGYVNCKNVDDITYFSYVYQYTDHLGNIRMSYAYDYDINELVILEENNYYPFGLKHGQYNTMIIVPLPEDEIPPIGSVTGKMKFVFVQVPNSGYQYQYNGKEWQDELGLNVYDYGARNYDPAIGRWNVMDAKGELYFGKSPYIYALNTPIQAIDPDGNVVIFINGQHTGDGGKAEYWRKYEKVKTYAWTPFGYVASWEKVETLAFDSQIMNHLRDQRAIYRDGAMGGFNNTLWEPRTSKNNLYSSSRITAGYEQGKADAAEIIKSLAKDQTTGEIVETIKIITHSMGGAYGKGYVKALKEYIKTLPKDQQKQIKITLVADFDPFQASSLNADPNIFTQQFTHLGGTFGLAEDRQEGLSDDNYYESNGDHSIFTFTQDISKLEQGIYKWNGSEWVCTTCKK